MITTKNPRGPLVAPALTAALIGLTLAGCAGGVQTSAPATATPADVTTAPESTTPPVSNVPSASATNRPTTTVTETMRPTTTSRPTTSTAPAGPARGDCTLSDLAIGINASAGGGGAAGSNYVALTFTNVGDQDCTIVGYPGVSWVGKGNGTQIGAAATRSGDKAPQTVLSPKESAPAVLRIVQAGNYGDSCKQTKTDGFRVYPPGSTTSAFVRYAGEGCANADVTTLEISPIGAG